MNITLDGPDDNQGSEDATFLALVDSGAERVLAAPGVARQIRVTPDRAHAEPPKIGGEIRMAHPAEVGFFSEWTSLPGRCCADKSGSSTGHRDLQPACLQLAVADVHAFDQRSM